MASENATKGIEIAKSFLDAVHKKDVDGAAQQTSMDFQLEVFCADNRYTGVFKGRDAIKTFFQKRDFYITYSSFDAKEFYATGDGKVVSIFVERKGTTSAKEGGKNFTERANVTIWLNSFFKISKVRDNCSKE